MIDDSIKRANNSTKTENINIVTTFFFQEVVFKNNSRSSAWQASFFCSFSPLGSPNGLHGQWGFKNAFADNSRFFFLFLVRDLIQFAVVQQIFADNHAEGKKKIPVSSQKHTSLFLS